MNAIGISETALSKRFFEKVSTKSTAREACRKHLNTVMRKCGAKTNKRLFTCFKADKSVDMILTDHPFNTTSMSWDKMIPIEPMWNELKRITNSNSAILLFGIEPFSSKIRMSNLDMYRYDWTWRKSRASGFAHAKTCH